MREALWAFELVDLLLIKIFMRLNQQSIPDLDANPNYDKVLIKPKQALGCS